MMEAVAHRLTKLMQEKNLTMNGFALNFAVPPSTFKNVFYSKSKNTGVVTVKLLCDGMGITVTEFFDSPFFVKLMLKKLNKNKPRF